MPRHFTRPQELGPTGLNDPTAPSLEIPAFLGLLVGRGGLPARAVAAWALLAEFGVYPTGAMIFDNSRAGHYLARAFAIHPASARRLLRAGEGRLWSGLVQGKRWLYPRRQLWDIVAADEAAPPTVACEWDIPVLRATLLGPLADLHAILARPLLARGPLRPMSCAAAGRHARRSRSTVTAYRRWLRQHGYIAIEKKYRRGRKINMNGTLAEGVVPRARNEFNRYGYIYRRLPDIVCLTRPDGELLDVLANAEPWGWLTEDGEQCAWQPFARRYFPSPQAYHGWRDRGLPVDKLDELAQGEEVEEWEEEGSGEWHEPAARWEDGYRRPDQGPPSVFYVKYTSGSTKVLEIPSLLEPNVLTNEAILRLENARLAAVETSPEIAPAGGFTTAADGGIVAVAPCGGDTEHRANWVWPPGRQGPNDDPPDEREEGL